MGERLVNALPASDEGLFVDDYQTNGPSVSSLFASGPTASGIWASGVWASGVWASGPKASGSVR